MKKHAAAPHAHHDDEIPAPLPGRENHDGYIESLALDGTRHHFGAGFFFGTAFSALIDDAECMAQFAHRYMRGRQRGYMPWKTSRSLKFRMMGESGLPDGVIEILSGEEPVPDGMDISEVAEKFLQYMRTMVSGMTANWPILFGPLAG